MLTSPLARSPPLSVIFVSIWRLVQIVEHQAGWYPDNDPTWYGPLIIVLADLELDLASICASVPVFWPALEQGFERIFITREVQITREDRWAPPYNVGVGSAAPDHHAMIMVNGGGAAVNLAQQFRELDSSSQLGLTKVGKGEEGIGGKTRHLHSRNDSDTELGLGDESEFRDVGAGDAHVKEMAQYADNVFVMGYIDPLSEGPKMATTTVSRVEGGQGSKRPGKRGLGGGRDKVFRAWVHGRAATK